MPNYFAHEVYGNRVLGAMQEPLRSRIEREKTAFWLGLYGPDPLFFLPGKVRDEARAMHRQPAQAPVLRLMEAVHRGVPESTGYLAGFLCHFLLDSLCHPYILELARTGELNHTAIETELDRYLLAQRGFRTDRETPMVSGKLPTAACEAAAFAYPTATPGHFHRAYGVFYRASRAMTLFQGTPVRQIVHAVSCVPTFAPLRGCVSGRKPDSRAQASNLTLEAMLFGAVESGAARIMAVFAALDRGESPDMTFLQKDFFGR